MAKKKASRKRTQEPPPEDGLRALARTLEGGLPPLVVLRGEERYFRERGITMATAAAREAGMEVCRHDAIDPEYSAAALLDDLSTGALFQSARCVVVHGADRIVTERATKFSAPIRDAIKARLSTGAEGLIVLSGDKLRADNPIAKLAAEAGWPVVGCRRLYDSPPAWDPDPRKAELVLWCAGRAKGLGIPLDLGEAAYICAATGNDLSSIEDQLARLVGRGREAIQELIAWDATASPWDVAEQIVSGDVKRAVAGIETLFNGGASQRDGSRTIDTAGIVAQLSVAVSGKLREALKAAAALQSGMSPPQAIAAAGIRGPRAATEAFEKRLRSRPPSHWRPMLDQLGGLERRSRSSVTVDATDFVHLALAWRQRGRVGR